MQVGIACMRVTGCVRVVDDNRVAVVRGVIDDLVERIHDTEVQGIAFLRGQAVQFRGVHVVVKDELLECEQHVRMDILVVRSPATGGETAGMSEETALEVFQVKLVVR